MAKGDKVRVSEAYRDRASLLHYARSPADLTLRLESLRQNDTGFYRCEVQQGLEDADDVVHIQVKGEHAHPSFCCPGRSKNLEADYTEALSSLAQAS